MADDLKTNGSITFSDTKNGATIEIRDNASREEFVEVRLTASQLCQALSRSANTPCEIKTRNLDRVGKTMIMDDLVFEMPKHCYINRKDVAKQEATRVCPDGWTPDLYFGSQRSFFSKDGKEYARTTIRRWE